ncbi:MAG: hypothetical protein GTN89_01315, partial [Acidobacteria bacterium]|nr:hypothetical protein [Acidobacteriota bacterium]NIM61147.1 hypothetical protein [Acidobacteriota bacterium]NIO58022.1 hypothetical protein [Acidobacteriota bacterium]NIQ29029.1 hypothetical protein [Acidobacteriota bacterium]NIQ83555.1 hypothetical protein [Acidobacteriota bacterium]
MNRTTLVARIGLLAVLLLATFGHAGSQPDVLLAWHALLLVTTLLAWWFTAPGATGHRPSAGTALALAALCLVLVVGFARAPYRFAAWLTMVEVAAFVAAFALAIRTGPRLVVWLGPALLSAGWLQTGLLFYQRFVTGDPRPAGTFNNPNYLAGWLAATVLFCAGRWITRPADRVARGSAAAAIPLLAGIAITGSRGALVGIAAGGLLLAGLVWKGLAAARRKQLVAAFVVVGVAASVAVFVRLQQPDPFRYQRLKIWRASVVPLLDAPWSGTGPGQFVREAPNLQFPDGRGALRYDRGFRTTHSDWIRVAAELGWPGVWAFGWVVVSVGAHIARRRRRSDPLDIGAVAALGALFAQSAVDNVSRAPALYLVGAVLLGLVVTIEAPVRRPVRPLWRAVVVLVAVHLFVVGDVAPWRA